MRRCKQVIRVTSQTACNRCLQQPNRTSRRTAAPRQEQAPIATNTPQQQAITEALEKVITAINQADLAEKEKNEAKSLLRKLLGSKAAAKVLGEGAQSLGAKYFTE